MIGEHGQTGITTEETSGRRLRRDRKQWARQGLTQSRNPGLECPQCSIGYLRWYLGTLFCNYCAKEFNFADHNTEARGTGSPVGVDPALWGGLMPVRKAVDLAHHARTRGW